MKAKIEGFTPAPDILLKNHGPIRALVYGKYWRYWDAYGMKAAPAQKRVAEELGIDDRTLRNHLAALISDGYLEDRTPDLQGKPHTYAPTEKLTIEMLMSIVENDGVGIRFLPPRNQIPTTPESDSYKDSKDTEERKDAPGGAPVDHSDLLAGLPSSTNHSPPALSAAQYKERVRAALGNVDPEKARLALMGVDVSNYPPDVKDIIFRFCTLWNMRPPQGKKGGDSKDGKFSDWIKGARDLIDAAGEYGLAALDGYHATWLRDMEKKNGIAPITVSRPGSVVEGVRATAGLMRSGKFKAPGAPDQSRLFREEHY